MLDALPHRPPLHRRITELLAVATVGAPAVGGDRVFTLERSGDADQAVLTVRSAIDRAAPARVLIDPHALAADHAAAIDWFSPSPGGRLVAYGVSEGGSEHGTLRIAEVADGDVRHLDDTIPHVRHPAVAWLPDGSAFAYNRLPDPSSVAEGDEGYWETVWWHRVGDDFAADEPVLTEGLDRTALPMAGISKNGRWLVVHIHLMPTRTDVVLIDRQSGSRTVVVEEEEASTWCQVVDDQLLAVTTLDAPRGRVVTASLDQPQAEHWSTLVAESDAVVDSAVVAGDSLLVASMQHAVSRLHRYDRSGGLVEEIALPALGSLGGLDADPDVARVFLSFSSFTQPSALWRWEPGRPVERWSPEVAVVDPDAFVVEQVFYPSNDLQRVPMFLVRAASTQPGATTPTVLTGYGGFAVASTPGFGPGLVAFCEAGGVYAIAGIRGGSEYGEDWHRAGMLDRKQQCFDDFYAAAEWLIAEKRTSPEHLAIRGGSNGGLLMGAAITQRPELFRAVVCAVPLLDMLRYHLLLIGALWVPEYGDPDQPDDFGWLHAYSPYHRVEQGVEQGTAYPATLITTAESDSRVDPMHARKFAAALQAATNVPDAQPVLLRVEARAGHGVGKPAWKQAEEAADTWAFVFWQLGLPAGTVDHPSEAVAS